MGPEYGDTEFACQDNFGRRIFVEIDYVKMKARFAMDGTSATASSILVQDMNKAVMLFALILEVRGYLYCSECPGMYAPPALSGNQWVIPQQ